MKVKIGTKSYECGKYGTSELADLQDWLKERQEDRVIKRARKIYGDDLPDRIYDEISKEITFDDLEDAITSDLRSIEYLIYLTVHKSHPDVTEKEISEGLSGIENAIQIVADLSPAAKKKPAKPKQPAPATS